MNNEQLKTFLVGYVDDANFQEALIQKANDSIEINEFNLEYVKCKAPNIDAVTEMLSRRFPDVHIINISLEEDYLNALKILATAQNNQTAYISNTVDESGMAINEIVLEVTDENKNFIIAEMEVSELKKTFLKTKSIFSDTNIPLINWNE